MVLGFVFSVGSQAHEVGSPALALHHVADGFLVQGALGQHTDDQGPRLDEADGAMLQFAGGVGLGMNVGDFLQLETAFQTHGVVAVSYTHLTLPTIVPV